MEALFGLILLAVFFGICFWKFPELMKEIFSFKKKPVEPPAPSVSAEVVRVHDHSRSGGHEHIGYINEPIQPPVVKVPKHEIIKHDYYNAYNSERWPRWTCKCGQSGYAITTKFESLETTEREARRDGQDHVRKATIIDDRLEQSNGKFAF